ncbi:MAG: ImmA/IrrE family metallo-endopeptidase [Acidobacteriia bacterium]|nr:ImmA/IrrE family metallo-endopeptidase [Terriglobia bacterium]
MDLEESAPIDGYQLAKHLGIQVWTPRDIPGLDQECLRTLLHIDSDSWSAVTLCVGPKDLIIINSSHAPSRQASDLTHEIAHTLIGHEPSRVDVTPDGLLLLDTYDRQQEEEAKWLAGALLLPRIALLSIMGRRLDLKVAAKQYGVSFKMLTYRISVTGVETQYSRAKRFSKRASGR